MPTRKRQIQIPPPAVVLGVEISYAVFVRHLCDTDERFIRTAAGIRTAVRIEAAIISPYAGAAHVLEESDWNVLQEVAETPTAGYPELQQSTKDGSTKKFQTGRACLAFVDAISSASLIVE